MKIVIPLIVIGMILFAILAIYAINTLGKNRAGRAQELEAKLKLAERQVRTAQRGLGEIASGVTGNPVLSAQVTLDEINYMTQEVEKTR